jgi:hypothetical protein
MRRGLGSGDAKGNKMCSGPVVLEVQIGGCGGRSASSYSSLVRVTPVLLTVFALCLELVVSDQSLSPSVMAYVENIIRLSVASYVREEFGAFLFESFGSTLFGLFAVDHSATDTTGVLRKSADNFVTHRPCFVFPF